MNDFKRAVRINAGIALGSMLIVGISSYFLVRYMQSTSEAITENRITISLAGSALDRFFALKRDAEVARRIQNDITALLPPQEQLLSFPQFLDGIARSHTVGISFSFQGALTPSQAGSSGVVGFTLSVSGPLERIAQFLKTIEEKSTKFIVGFDSVDVTASGGEYRATMQGKVFFK